MISFSETLLAVAILAAGIAIGFPVAWAIDRRVLGEPEWIEMPPEMCAPEPQGLPMVAPGVAV